MSFAVSAAALDTRVKAVVGQVGFADGERFLLDTRRFGERDDLLRKVAGLELVHRREVLLSRLRTVTVLLDNVS